MLIPYFPNSFSLSDYNSIIKDKNKEFNLINLGFNKKYQFVNSASQGIYLLLKSFNLEPGTKVGLPPLVCNTVTTAIIKAGFTPYYFDINKDYVLNYDEHIFCKSEIKALILPHLYGALHPDSEKIINWCKNNKVLLILDSAQSFGLEYKGLPVIEIGEGGVYSFGFGKSSTCAGGAIVYNLNRSIIYAKNPFYNLINYTLSKNKLASRIFGLNKYRKNYLFNIFNSYLSNLTSNQILGISSIQFNSLKKYLNIIDEIQIKRNNNYSVLKNNLNPKYFIVPESYANSLKFKYTFTLNMDVRIIPDYILTMQNEGIEIHKCSRTDSIHTDGKRLPYYNKLKNNLFELSTESSIPEENFYKAADIMNSYLKKILELSG